MSNLIQEHHFNINVAKQFGVNCAIILNNIVYWYEKNKENGVNFYDGKYWTYNTSKAWAKLFPYFTVRQVEYCLKQLYDNGILFKDCYNKDPRDRTNWYSLNEEKYFEIVGCKLQKCKMEQITNLSNGDYKNVEALPNNKHTNINNTDNKQEYIQEGDNCPPTCPPQEKNEGGTKVEKNPPKKVEVLIEHPILTYWNSKKIIVHSPSNTINKAIAKALKEFSEEEIKLYIDRYVKVINDPLYGFKYVWTLAQFLTQKNAMSDFTDEGSKWVNYLNNQNKRVQSLKPKKGSTQPSIFYLNFSIEE